MPVYNVASYVAEAVKSVLEQTFEDFELIIIDDGSTDETYNIINQFNDRRIIKLQNKINLGIAYTLNEGISMAKGIYIVRMDGDDISLKERFEKQICFMNDNPDLLLSGTYMEAISEKGTSLQIYKKPVDQENIKIGLFFGHTSFAHPSIIIRKEVMDSYHLRYDSAFRYAEDYDLYCRSSQYALMANIPECLIQYRIHDESVSRKYNIQQQHDARLALYLHLLRLGLPFTPEDFMLHSSIAFPSDDLCFSEEKIQSWFKYVLNWNTLMNHYDKEQFEKACSLYQRKLYNRGK